MTPSLPIELLLDILSLHQDGCDSLLDAQLSTLRFGRVCRGWYFASLAGTDLFITNGLDQTIKLSNHLARATLPVKRLSVTLPCPFGGPRNFRQKELLSPPKALQTLLNQCAGLRTLEIATGLWITVTVLKKSRHCLQSLTTLTLSEYEMERGVAQKETSCENFVEAISSFPNLQEFNMHTKCINWDSDLNSDALTTLSLPNLTSLSCETYDMELFSAFIVAGQHTLRSLHLGTRALLRWNISEFERISPTLHHFSTGEALYDYSGTHNELLVDLVKTMVSIRTLRFSSGDSPARSTRISVYVDILQAVRQYDNLRRIDFGLVAMRDVNRLIKQGLNGRKRRHSHKSFSIQMEVQLHKSNNAVRTQEKLARIRKACKEVGVKLEITTVLP